MTAVAISGKEIQFPIDMIFYKQLTMRGSITYTANTWRRMMEIYATGKIDFSDMISVKLPITEWEQAFDLVLLDPPRAGAVEIMERMPQWRPRRLVYISCHPGSLARDAGILVGGQGYRLIGAGVMDMFPHTTHVESIAVFERGA